MAPVQLAERDRRRSAPRRDDAVVARQSPLHRAPLAVRSLIAIVALGACAFAAALMVSDRAPTVLVDVFGDTIRQLWDRVDASRGGRLPAEADLPEKDFIVHVTLWAAITFLAALAIWSWRGLLAAAVAVFGLSVVIELAQGRFSSTRSVESVDAVANGVGVALGAAAAAVVLVGWNLVATAIDAWRPADGRGAR